MIIAPLVFATLVSGLAGMEGTSDVRRIGLRSVGWFVCASLFSLALGLVLANALQPGAGLHMTQTSSDVATGLIAQFEPLDRRRYAGPVGWIDATGDGEWGIGLRSAQIESDGTLVRLFAGCGIVADSIPEDELAESNAKFVPVRDALSARD